MQPGKYSYIHDNNLKVYWGDPNQIKIGAFCSIAEGCSIFLGGNHNIKSITTYPFGCIFQDKFPNATGKYHNFPKPPVVIGNDVWIAANVRIMPGVTIGDGAVIANNSHVVKDVEPYSIVGGNPAKHIRYRFRPDQIAKLLEIKWWDWPDENINSVVHLLEAEDIEAFFKYCESLDERPGTSEAAEQT